MPHQEDYQVFFSQVYQINDLAAHEWGGVFARTAAMAPTRNKVNVCRCILAAIPVREKY